MYQQTHWQLHGTSFLWHIPVIFVACVTSIHSRFDITVEGGSAGASSSSAGLAAATAKNGDCSSSSIGDDAEIDFAPLDAFAGSEGRGAWQQQ